jgi:hypothetical protein
MRDRGSAREPDLDLAGADGGALLVVGRLPARVAVSPSVLDVGAGPAAVSSLSSAGPPAVTIAIAIVAATSVALVSMTSRARPTEPGNS